jgi:hypothetical protein
MIKTSVFHMTLFFVRLTQFAIEVIIFTFYILLVL